MRYMIEITHPTSQRRPEDLARKLARALREDGAVVAYDEVAFREPRLVERTPDAAFYAEHWTALVVFPLDVEPRLVRLAARLAEAWALGSDAHGLSVRVLNREV